MARTDRDVDRAYQTIDRMVSLIRTSSYSEADKLGRQELRRRQNHEYDRATHGDDDERGDFARRELASVPTPREQFRKRLFSMTSPARILAPVNTLEVYLADHVMWESWGWSDTHAVNALMLPFVQGLDPADPLPDDPRLALPFTVAATALSRALHLSPDLSPDELTADVYRLVAEGIVTLDRLGAPEGLAEDFAHVTDAAVLLLLHAVRLGLAAWGHRLILPCALGARCKRQEPFYVNAPKAKAGHGACRVAAHRSRLQAVKPDVTTKVRAKKK